MQGVAAILDLLKGADAAEREGHKYVQRWWNGSKWEYEYANAPAEKHGPAAGGLEETTQQSEVTDERTGETRTKTTKLVRAHRTSIESGAVPPGTPPEQAYKEALKRSLSAGPQKLAHPAFKDPLTITSDGKEVTVSAGAESSLDFASQKAKTVARNEKTFANHAAFEVWMLKSSNQVTMSGPDGKAWLTITPVVGVADKDKNEIKWSTEADRQWTISYHPLYDGKALDNSYKGGKFADATSYEHAVNQVVKEFNARASATGTERVDAASFLAKHPNPAAMPSREEHKDAEAKGEPPPSRKPGEKEDLDAGTKGAFDKAEDASETLPEAAAGSAAAFMQGEAKWGYDESRAKGERRHLKVSAQERQKIINDVAHEFWPAIIATGDRWLNTAYSRDDRDQHMERIVGAAGVDQYLSTRTPDRKHVFLDPESPVGQAIGRAVDNYDPEYRRKDGKKVGFSGFLIGKNGVINNAFHDEYKNIRTRSEATDDRASASMYEANSSRIKGATADQKEEGEHHLDPEEHLEQEQHRDPKVVAQTLTPLITKWAMANPEKKVIIDKTKAALRAIRSSSNADVQQQHMNELLQVLTDDPPKGAGMVSDLSRLLGKSLTSGEHEFLQWMVSRDLVRKAMAVLSKDKNADPNHEYSHREGDEDNPRYFWKDQMGNLVRYTNAPQGADDRSDHFGEAKLHPGEPDAMKNPEYFSPDGRKLTRVPEVDPTAVEWNQKYNQYDPKNMWVGRWRDPNNGEYRFTYVHSDIRLLPKLQIHQTNALVDVRIPSFRQYVAKLFNGSQKMKDQMTAVALALLDQGKMRSIELAALTSDHIQFEGNIITLGGRRIFGCPKMVAALDMLKRTTPGGMPLFSVPQQTSDKVNPLVRRMMGPHYLARVVDTQGLSLLGFQTYHGTISFSREVDRAIIHYQANWEQACSHALMVVAKEWGHDLSVEPDPLRVLQLVQEVLVDPVVMRVMQTAAQEQRLLGAQPSQTLPPPTVPIPFVAIDAVDRNAEEQEFSDWIHTVAVHDFAEFPEQIVDPATAAA